jgi:hypothetical protein
MHEVLALRAQKMALLSLCEGRNSEAKKAKLSSVLNYAPYHEDVSGSGGIAPQFLTSTLDVGEWSASRPCRQGKEPAIPIG